MKILVIGGGGREHAVGWALNQSPLVTGLWFAPGNGGTAQIGQNIPVSATDLDGVLAFCKENSPDLVAVLPDDPQALGMVDMLEKHGFPCFGASQAAAMLESSKSFAKDFMLRHGIPTAAGFVAHTKADALAYANQCPIPIVVKADGLALGKGVIICFTREMALDAVNALSSLVSGSTLVFEEYLEGPEVTQLAFVSGQDISLMPALQDHKRIFDGDKGPNTGGMGAFSPVTVYDDAMRDRCMAEVFLPTLRGLKAEGIIYKGVIYFSLMLTADGPRVIEYNARFGDPEAQAVLPLLESDLAQIMLDVRSQCLDSKAIRWKNAASCCVVMASGGYPESYPKGFQIIGVDAVQGATVFHAGTALKDGKLITSGGRVLGITAVAPTLAGAVSAAYSQVEIIDFQGAFYRKDIAAKDPRAQVINSER